MAGFVRAHMCVHTDARAHVCLHLHMCVCMCACLCACAHLCVCVRVCAYTRVCVCVCLLMQTTVQTLLSNRLWEGSGAREHAAEVPAAPPSLGRAEEWRLLSALTPGSSQSCPPAQAALR